MIVLTINSGSTSVKLAAYEAHPGGACTTLATEHSSGNALEPRPLLKSFLSKLRSRPDAVVHRVVHGGTRFTAATLIDDAAVAEIADLAELAPLHNPKALEWIQAAREFFPGDVPQVAAFDTAFFASMPRVATEYALPRTIGVDHGVRRYGFHGLAHEAMLRRWSELHSQLPKDDRQDTPPKDCNSGRLITLQLGGGCSITAIANGKPVDTSMGFSPLEGLVMATRSGDVDPAILPFLERRLGTGSEQLVAMLNRESGLAGLSGGESNPGKLLSDPAPQSQFAVDLYCYRARKYVGAYLAVLGGCDAIVFGGGVGEHVPGVRERILAGMQWAGIELDPAANRGAQGQEAAIHAPHSRVGVHVIPVDEELLMVRGGLAVLARQGTRPA